MNDCIPPPAATLPLGAAVLYDEKGARTDDL